jgi:hypothetical protein
VDRTAFRAASIALLIICAGTACTGGTAGLNGGDAAVDAGMDAAALDGAVADAQQVEPDATVYPPTFVGTILLSELTDYRTSPSGLTHGVVDIRFIDVRNATLIPTQTVAPPIGGCQLEHIGCWSTNGSCPTQLPLVDLGAVRIRNVTAGGSTLELSATYSATATSYIVEPPQFDLDLGAWLTLSAEGKSGRVPPWGCEASPLCRLGPLFPLEPDAAARSLLANPSAAAAVGDLQLGFNTISTQPNPELVRATLGGTRYRIVCDQNEEDPQTFMNEIVIDHRLIRSFMDREGISSGSGATADLSLSRLSEATMLLPGWTSTTGAIVQVELANSYVGRVVF